MSKTSRLSVVVPILNEALCVLKFHKSLTKILDKVDDITYEIIYVDDGSADKTIDKLSKICDGRQVKLLALSRNFGKEAALSAGIYYATGDAILSIDSDGQHPVSKIPEFIQAWRAGSQVVIGVRTNNDNSTVLGKLFSRPYYWFFNKLSKQKLIANSTDFRLIDKEVQGEFIKLYEVQRMVRALIDWMGYETCYISFEAGQRIAGSSKYDFKRLFNLATESLVSMSYKPLSLISWCGVAITVTSFILGVAVIVEQVILRDPLGWAFTGPAMLGILIIFLVGIIMISQGILAMYVASIHYHAKRRPLFIVNRRKSKLD